MNRSATQFWVAILTVMMLGGGMLMLLWGAVVIGTVATETAVAAFGSFAALAGTATAWLFRLNGSGK